MANFASLKSLRTNIRAGSDRLERCCGSTAAATTTRNRAGWVDTEIPNLGIAYFEIARRTIRKYGLAWIDEPGEVDELVIAVTEEPENARARKHTQ